MKDGLYRVRFDNDQDDFGYGVLTVRSNVISGGDHTCYYQGRLNDGKAELHAIIHNQGRRSVFGAGERFDLELNFTDMPGGILFNGHIKGQPEMTVNGSMSFLSALI